MVYYPSGKRYKHTPATFNNAMMREALMGLTRGHDRARRRPSNIGGRKTVRNAKEGKHVRSKAHNKRKVKKSKFSKMQDQIKELSKADHDHLCTMTLCNRYTRT